MRLDFSGVVTGFAGKDIYLHMSEENPDWTVEDSSVNLVVHYGGRRASLPMGDDGEVEYLASSIHHFISPETVVLAWRAKDFFSFLRGRSGISVEMPARVWDLHVISSYFGYGCERPETFRDAVALLRRAFSEPGWEGFRKFYESVHMPLFSSVLPDIETSCLVDSEKRSCVYPSYVLEGQVNGRLKAFLNGPSSYNPHSLGMGDRLRLRPPDYDSSFVCFDFRNMEVAVLAWLSGDSRLAGIISSGRDPYSEIWKIVAREEPDPSKRELCKNVFLPVVFGQGKGSLSRRLDISEKIAGMVIDRLVKAFPVAFDWVCSGTVDSGGYSEDSFGRRRHFPEGERYKMRNFRIQSPASMVCLKKLVDLHGCLPAGSLRFHLHDGYCVVCGDSEVERVADTGVRCLESADPMFAGLFLKTSCKTGKNLNNLESIKGRVLN